MLRFTKKDLAEEVKQINAEFEKAGCDARFVLRPAYGRQYVYVQSVKSVESGSTSQGEKISDGTPRQCSDVMWPKYLQLLRHHYKELYDKTYAELVVYKNRCGEIEGELAQLRQKQGEKS